MKRKFEEIVIGITGISLGILSGIIIDRISWHITPENWIIGDTNPVPIIILAIMWSIYFVKKVKDRRNI